MIDILSADILDEVIGVVNFLDNSQYRDILRLPFFELYLPTEVVIDKPQIVTPVVARVYRTDLYRVEPPRYNKEALVPYERLRTLSGFKGTSQEKTVYLWEVWTDEGDDGHVAYKHRGYMFSLMEPDQDRAYPINEINRLCW